MQFGYKSISDIFPHLPHCKQIISICCLSNTVFLNLARTVLTSHALNCIKTTGLLGFLSVLFCNVRTKVVIGFLHLRAAGILWLNPL